MDLRVLFRVYNKIPTTRNAKVAKSIKYVLKCMCKQHIILNEMGRGGGGKKKLETGDLF